MQIRKFVGNDMHDIMKKIKSELGENAVILHTKKISKGGILGFFKKELLEVLAALEKDKPIGTSRKTEIDSDNDKKHILDLDKKIINEQNKIIEKDLSQEVKELKKLLEKINNKVDINISGDNQTKVKFRKYYELLKNIGLENDLIEDILLQIECSHINETDFDNEIERYLMKKFNTENYKNFDFTKKINVFVGATGVGKTTTIAKLASEMVLKEDKKIGFLTLDTYRISAVEQLKTYADILNAPVEVAYDMSDVGNSLDRLKNRELLFVDTAGRSYKNKKQMNELKEFISYFKEKDVFLVLSANWDINDIKEILRAYDFLDDYKIIITKLDETNRLGVILNILNNADKVVTHITFGQNVPDDIEKFDFKKTINEVLRG